MSPIEIAIIGAILLLLFGASRLPKIARAFGRLPNADQLGYHESQPEDDE